MEDHLEQAVTRLQLARLPEMTELARPLAEALALAGSVALCGFHETPDVPAVVAGTPVGPGEGRAVGTRLRPDGLRAIISRLAVGAVELATFADPDEAVELGAAGVGCSVAHTCLGHVAFRRLPIGTGADYLMRPLDRLRRSAASPPGMFRHWAWLGYGRWPVATEGGAAQPGEPAD